MINLQYSLIPKMEQLTQITSECLLTDRSSRIGLALKGVSKVADHIETMSFSQQKRDDKLQKSFDASSFKKDRYEFSTEKPKKWLELKLYPSKLLASDWLALPAADAAPIDTKTSSHQDKLAQEYEKWQLQSTPSFVNISDNARTDPLQNSTIPVYASNSIFMIDQAELDKLEEINHFTDEELTIVGVISMAESIYFARHNQLLPDIQPTKPSGLSLKQLTEDFITSPNWYADAKLTEFLANISTLTKPLTLTHSKQIHLRSKRDVLVPTNTPISVLDSLYDGVNEQEFFTYFFELVTQEEASIYHKQEAIVREKAATKVEQAKAALRHVFNQKMQLIASIVFEKIVSVYALKDMLKEVTQDQRVLIEAKLESEIPLIDDIIYFSYKSFYDNFIKGKALSLDTLADDDLDFLLQTVAKQATDAKMLQNKFAVTAALKEKYASAVRAFLQTKLEKIASKASQSFTVPPVTTPLLFPTAINATVSSYSEQDLAHIANIVTKLKMAGHKGAEPQLNAKATHWYEKGGKTLAGLYLVNNMTNIIDPDQMVKSCTLENVVTNVVSVINPGFGIGIQFKGLVENIRDEVDDTVLSAEEKERVFDLLKQKVEEKFKTQGNNPDLSELREALAILLSPQPDVQKLRELGIPIKTSEQKAIAVTKSIAGFVLPLVVPAIGIITALYDLIQAVAEDDLDICRYAMDTFILASSVFDPEEAGMMKKSGAAEHPVFGGVEKMAEEDSAFLKEQFGKDDAILEKFKIGELIAPTEFEKPLLNPILEKEYALHEIEGEKHRYAMVHDAKGEEILFKEVDVHGSKQLEFVAGNEALASQYRITEDGNHIIHEEGMLKGDLSEGEINSKLQALTQEKAKLEHQLEYSINRVAELSVIKDSLNDAIEIANKHANGHPEPAKIQGYISELQTTFKETSERISLWQKAKQQAASKLNFNANYVAFLKQALADKTSLQALNNEINAAHMEVKDAFAELNAAKEALEKAKSENLDLDRLSAVKGVKEIEYNDALARLERTIDQGQQLKKAIARQHVEEIQKSADERANALVEEHKRCRRSNETCVAKPADATERQTIGEEFWRNIGISSTQEAFKTQFTHYLQSDLIFDTTIEESANAVILDSPAKLKLEFEALFRRRIELKRNVILHNAERKLKLENALKIITDAQQIEMVKSEIVQLEQNTKQVFNNAFSQDVAAYQEAKSMDLSSLPKSEVSRLIASVKAELAALAKSSSNLTLDGVFLKSNQDRVNAFIESTKDVNDSGSAASNLDHAYPDTEQLSHTEVLKLMKDELSTLNMDSIDLPLPEEDFPKKFYTLKEAVTANEAMAVKIQAFNKLIDLIKCEQYQGIKNQAFHMKKYRAKTAFVNYFKAFAKKSLEHKSYVDIVGSPKENEFIPEWTMEKMAKWTENRKPIIRTKARVKDLREKFLDNLGKSDLTPNQIQARIKIYLENEGEGILAEIASQPQHEDLPAAKNVPQEPMLEPVAAKIPLKPSSEGKQSFVKNGDTINETAINETEEHAKSKVDASISETFPNIPEVNALSLEAGKAFGDIHKIIMGAQQKPISIESIKALNSLESKYHHCRVGLAEREFLLSLQEVRYGIQDAVIREKSMFESASDSDVFWRQNPEIKKGLEVTCNNGILYEKLLSVITKGKDSIAPANMNRAQISNWVTSRYRNFASLDAKFTERELQLEARLRDAGLNIDDVKQRVNELLQSPELTSILLDVFAQDPEYSTPALLSSKNQGIASSSLVKLQALVKPQVVKTSFENVYQRVMGKKQTPISVESIKDLGVAPITKYHHCQAGLAERYFLISLQEFRYEMQAAIIREKISPAQVVPESDVFWQQNPNIIEKVTAIGKNGASFEKRLNVITEGRDKIAPENMTIEQTSDWVSARYKTIASLDKKIAKQEALLEAQLRNAGLTAENIKQRLDELVQSPKMKGLLLDAFQQELVNNQGNLSGIQPPHTPVMIEREITQAGMQALGEVFTKITHNQAELKVTQPFLNGLDGDATLKYYFSNAALAERRFLSSLAEVKLDMLNVLASEQNLHVVNSEQFWLKNQALRNKFKELVSVGVYSEKTMRIIVEGNHHTPPAGLTEPQITESASKNMEQVQASSAELQKAQADFQARARALGFDLQNINPSIEHLLGSSEATGMILEVMLNDPEYSQPTGVVAKSPIHHSESFVHADSLVAPQSPIDHPQSFEHTDALFSLTDNLLEEVLLNLGGIDPSVLDDDISQTNIVNQGSAQERDISLKDTRNESERGNNDIQQSNHGVRQEPDQAASEDLGAELAKRLRYVRKLARIKEELRLLQATNKGKLDEIKANLAKVEFDQQAILRQIEREITEAQNPAEKKALQEQENQLKRAELETVKTKLMEIRNMEEVSRLEERIKQSELDKVEQSDDADVVQQPDPVLQHRLEQAKKALESAKQIALTARQTELEILRERAKAGRSKEVQSVADLADRGQGHELIDLEGDDKQSSQKRKPEQEVENDQSNIAAKQPRLDENLNEGLFGLLATFDVPEGMNTDFPEEDELSKLFFDAVGNENVDVDFSLLSDDGTLSADSRAHQPLPRFERALNNRKQKLSLNF